MKCFGSFSGSELRKYRISDDARGVTKWNTPANFVTEPPIQPLLRGLGSRKIDFLLHFPKVLFFKIVGLAAKKVKRYRRLRSETLNAFFSNLFFSWICRICE